MKSWILPLYSIVTYYIGSKTIDFVVEGIDKSKCAMIVTTKADEISDVLTDNFEASGTIVDAVGGYSKERKEIIYFIVNNFQINKLKKIVHTIRSMRVHLFAGCFGYYQESVCVGQRTKVHFA